MHLEMFRVLHQMVGYLDKNDYHCLMKFILRYMVMSICRESVVTVQESILMKSIRLQSSKKWPYGVVLQLMSYVSPCSPYFFDNETYTVEEVPVITERYVEMVHNVLPLYRLCFYKEIPAGWECAHLKATIITQIVSSFSFIILTQSYVSRDFTKSSHSIYGVNWFIPRSLIHCRPHPLSRNWA